MGQQAFWLAPKNVCLGAAALALAFDSRTARAAVENPPPDAAAAQAERGDLTLLSLEELANIRVTTVSRTESTVARSPAAVFVISREMIRRSGATSFAELFRMVPGMVVARVDGNKWAIGVRGFNQRFADKLLVQVDGRTVYTPLFSGVYWDAVDCPLEDVDRIEVIRGPGASVWGANAVNGIINVITKRAGQTTGALIGLGAGNVEHALGTIRYGGTRGETLHYRAYGKAFSRAKQFSTVGDANDGWWGASGGVRADWQSGAEDSFTVEGGLLRSEAGRKDLRPTAAAPFVFTNVETEITRGANAVFQWDRRRNTRSGFELRAYWDHVAREGDGFVDLRWDTLDVDFQHHLPLGTSQEIVYGVGYRYVDAFLGPSTNDGGFAVSFPPPDRHLHLFTAFVQHQSAWLGDEVRLTLGSKLEHNSFTGIEVQPTARLAWSPVNRHLLWAAVSRALRTPNLSEDGIGTRQLAVSTAPAIFPRLAGSPDLEPERLLGFEAGYRAQASRTLSVDLALFHNAYRDLRVAVPGALTPGTAGTFDLPLRFENRMKANTHGAEITTTWQPTDAWRLYAAYSFLSMDLSADAALPAGTRTNAEAAAGQNPRHQLYVQSSHDLPWQLQLDLIGRRAARLHGFNPAGVGGGDVIAAYTAFDARFGWRPSPTLEVALVGQNLLDSHHPETGTAQFLRSSPVEIRRAVLARVTIER